MRRLAAACGTAVKNPVTGRTEMSAMDEAAERARRLPLGPSAERQLRLINGVYAGGSVVSGRAVKIVE
jgi:hypothetical protein